MVLLLLLLPSFPCRPTRWTHLLSLSSVLSSYYCFSYLPSPRMQVHHMDSLLILSSVMWSYYCFFYRPSPCRPTTWTHLLIFPTVLGSCYCFSFLPSPCRSTTWTHHLIMSSVLGSACFLHLPSPGPHIDSPPDLVLSPGILQLLLLPSFPLLVQNMGSPSHLVLSPGILQLLLLPSFSLQAHHMDTGLASWSCPQFWDPATASPTFLPPVCPPLGLTFSSCPQSWGQHAYPVAVSRVSPAHWECPDRACSTWLYFPKKFSQSITFKAIILCWAASLFRLNVSWFLLIIPILDGFGRISAFYYKIN